jgi:hypothetical protein
MGYFATIRNIAGSLVYIEPVRATDPGFGGGLGGGVDPDYGQGHPGSPGHPGNALPNPPVKPVNPIVLPPGVWPPQVPPGVPDNTLPPGRPGFIPPDPDLGIEQPIYLPTLPPGVALLIALPYAQPKEGTPPNTKPAILVMSGKKPVLVYVTAGPSPK